MPTLNNLITNHSNLSAAASEWVHHLVGDWQVVADLSFSDLVLWLPVRDGNDPSAQMFVAAAHCRPATGATVYYEDPVSDVVNANERPDLAEVVANGVSQATKEPASVDDNPIWRETFPLRYEGRVIGAISQEKPADGPRARGVLETQYSQSARELIHMTMEGDFPAVGSPTGPRRGAPRVGDGMVSLDGEGYVTFASPNALSAFHRFGVMGDLVGQNLAEVTSPLLQGQAPVDESLPLVLMGRAAWRADVEARGVTLSLRSIPLSSAGERHGAVLLLRDVSELRRRERELLTKDATIREVHHRVKNNLQTVAALLRLQARRMETDEAKEALREAMRRVSTIALVHETLSQGFDETVSFDEIADRCISLAVDVAAVNVMHVDHIKESTTASRSVRTERVGKFGLLRAEDATALAMVITELTTNAVEHGLAQTGGTVRMVVDRDGHRLSVRIEDDGVGMSEDSAMRPDGLGTQIVRTLVTGELDGSITWLPREGGGTVTSLDLNLKPLNS
ncbi:histidine kinase N-terminal domain-containing protein [Micrococcales bacterium 31B]|nr:histidine kinase N-terminal domain-containing protein [Micrococcales bacterium 31B]